MRYFLDDSGNNSILSNFVEAISYNSTLTKDSEKNITAILKSKTVSTNQIKPLPSFSTSHPIQIKSGIIGFCSTFGSIAGCSAGIVGMLTSLGVFAGLAAVPLVGWVILGAAVILGLATAVIYARSTREKEKIEHVISHHKNLNAGLHKAIILKGNSQKNHCLITNLKLAP